MTSAAKYAVLVLVGGLALGCGDEPTTGQAFLSQPTGLAVAGEGADELFIANSGQDALQVGTLGKSIDDFKPLRGEVRLFPLQIPVGRAPTDLAATQDGRYVLALSPTDARVDLVDAVAKVPARDAAGNLVRVEFGAAAIPTALVADLRTDDALLAACEGDPCLGLFFVALAGQGRAAALVVRQAEDGTPSLDVQMEYDVPGTPVELAVDPAGRFLFVADGGAPTVHRINLSTGLVDATLDTGVTPGPIAVSANGSALLVGRPEPLDVIVFADADATPTLVDANAPLAPRPACLRGCEEPAETCSGAVQADLAVCQLEGDIGLAPTDVPQSPGIFIGVPPVALLAMPNVPLTTACDDSTVVYSDAVAVAGSDGILRFIGLRRAADAPLAPELVFEDACETATLEAASLYENTASTLGIGDPAPEELLTPCPATPERARFECVTSGGAGVVVFPGLLAGAGKDSVTVTLDWEGVVFDSDAGSLSLDGTELVDTSDLAQDRAEDRVQVGDFLVLTTRPLTGSWCAELGCDLVEARISALTRDEETGAVRYTLNPSTFPDPSRSLAECFGQSAELRYEVRAAGEYLVPESSGAPKRLAPGEVYGTGGVVGRSKGLLFGLRAASEAEVGLSVPSCERFTQVGTVNNPVFRRTGDPAVADLFSRNHPIGLVIGDPLDVAVLGVDVGADTFPRPPLGRLPGALILAPLSGGKQALFMSYTGSNSLFAAEPSNAKTFGDTDTFEIIN